MEMTRLVQSTIFMYHTSYFQYSKISQNFKLILFFLTIFKMVSVGWQRLYPYNYVVRLVHSIFNLKSNKSRKINFKYTLAWIGWYPRYDLDLASVQLDSREAFAVAYRSSMSAINGLDFKNDSSRYEFILLDKSLSTTLNRQKKKKTTFGQPRWHRLL